MGDDPREGRFDGRVAESDREEHPGPVGTHRDVDLGGLVDALPVRDHFDPILPAEDDDAAPGPRLHRCSARLIGREPLPMVEEVVDVLGGTARPHILVHARSGKRPVRVSVRPAGRLEDLVGALVVRTDVGHRVRVHPRLGLVRVGLPPQVPPDAINSLPRLVGCLDESLPFIPRQIDVGVREVELHHLGMEVVVHPLDDELLLARRVAPLSIDESQNLFFGQVPGHPVPGRHDHVDVLPVPGVVVAPVVRRVEEPVLEDELVAVGARRPHDLSQEGVRVDLDLAAPLLPKRLVDRVLEDLSPLLGTPARVVQPQDLEPVIEDVLGLGTQPRRRGEERVVLLHQLLDPAVGVAKPRDVGCREVHVNVHRSPAGHGCNREEGDVLDVLEALRPRHQVPGVDVETHRHPILPKPLDVHRDAPGVLHQEGREAHRQFLQDGEAAVVHSIGGMYVPVFWARRVAIQVQAFAGRRRADHPRNLQRHEAEVLVPRDRLRVGRRADAERAG